MTQSVIALRELGSGTVAQLASATGLSRPTVEAALATLLEQGLVLAEEPTGGGRDAGRPAKVVRFHPGFAHVAGLDVGSHTVRVMISDLAGTVVSFVEAPSRVDLGGAERMELLTQLVDQALAQAALRRTQLVAIGLAVAGIVGIDGRLALSHVLPAWTGLDIGGRLAADFGCEVRMENDMRAAALAEQHLGAARLAENVVYILAGHRMAASLIINGQLHRGRHGVAGSIGPLSFAPAIGANGVIEWENGASAELVFARAAAGEASAGAEIERFIGNIAPGIATIALLIDPDVLVLGGGISRAGAQILPALRAAVAAHITIPALPKIVASELGAESVVLGAVLLALGQAAARLYGTPHTPLPAIHFTAPVDVDRP